MRIGGIIDISTKDIPGMPSMVIFTVGCNLNCEFCHNKYLLHPNVGKEYQVNQVEDQVKNNQLVKGVSITGGEPTLQADLEEICRNIIKLGKYLSVDTNGTQPLIIEKILPQVNRIALDCKGPLKKEALMRITGSTIDPSQITKSIEILNNDKNIDFEIRTTYVEPLMKEEDIHEIIAFLSKKNFNGNFVLQQYQFSDGVGKEYKDKFQKPEYITLLNILKPYRNEATPFDIFLRNEIVGYKNIREIFNQLDEA